MAPVGGESRHPCDRHATTQVPTAQVIRRFRELGMPVREVREVLATTDPQARSALIAAHLERLENQLGRTRAAVTSLRRLLQPARPPIKIELRTAEAITTAAIRATVDHSELLGTHRLTEVSHLELVLCRTISLWTR